MAASRGEQYFYVARNDRLESLRCTLKSNGVAVDLTSSTVTFTLRKPGFPTAKVSASATIVTAASGIVEYQWAAGDTDEAGTYIGQFVETVTGRTRTFPNRKENRLYVVIEPDNA